MIRSDRDYRRISDGLSPQWRIVLLGLMSLLPFAPIKTCSIEKSRLKRRERAEQQKKAVVRAMSFVATV